MNGVTVGKYVPGTSFAYNLDPRVKLLFNIVYIVIVFLAHNFAMLGIALIPSVLLFVTSGLRRIQLFTMMVPVLLIGIFIFIINLFVIKSGDTTTETFMPITWWKITITEKAVFNTLQLMIRVYAIIVATSLLITTTKPTALTRAIEDLLLPFKLIRIPVHIIAMIISIALRFIPTLLEEAQRIMKAQASRGVDFKNGNTKAKIKALITLIIPLFVSAFAKAEDLGNAMEVRGYNPYEPRVRYRSYMPGWRDALTALVVFGVLAVLILEKNAVIMLPK